MILLHHSFALTTAVISCVFGVSASKDTTEQFSCYQGNIQSNTNGQIPLGSEQQLSSLSCGPQIVPTSATVRPTAAATVPGTTTPQSPALPPTEVPPATTQPTTAPPHTSLASRRRRNVPTSYMCTVYKSFPSGSKLTANVTWTAHFSCMPAENVCPEKTLCCNGTNCNELSFFQQVSQTKTATVGTCLSGSTNSTASQVVVSRCPEASQYCFNRTKKGTTKFGCSIAATQGICRNISTGGASACAKVGDSSVCCCASDNCNGPPRNATVYPTRMVPTTTSYLVTASKPSSNWMLVLFVSAGVLIGGLVGVVVMVLCRRWKKKRTGNGPLNISYSRVSADCANEDDDNIFSY